MLLPLIPLLVLALGCSSAELTRPAADTPPAMPVATITTQSCELAVRYEYALGLHSQMRAAKGQPLLEMNLSGVAVVLPLSAEDEAQAAQVQLLLTDMSIVGDKKTDVEKIEQLKQELQAPIWGRWRSGLLEAFYLPERTTPFAAGIWRTVVTSLQFRASAAAHAVPARPTVYDSNGDTEVSSSQLSTASAADTTWEKKKLKYTRGLLADHPAINIMGAPTPELVRATGEMALAKGVISRLHITDAVRYAISGQGTLSGTTDIKLELTRKIPQADVPTLPTTGVLMLAVGEPFNAPLPLDAMDAARMEGLTFEDIVRNLKARAEDPRRQHLVASRNDQMADSAAQQAGEAWTADWSRYFSALPAFFRQQPQTLKRAEKEILSGSPAARSFLGGLSATGTEAAQAVLLKLVDHPKASEAIRESAVRNVIQSRTPGAEVVAFVRNLHSHPHFSHYAPFAMGTVARKLRQDGNDDIATELVDELMSQLAEPSKSTIRLNVLMGIANSGHPSAFAAVQPLLESKSETERAAAIEAMRLMPLGRVDELYIRFMNESNEPSFRVRMAAVTSSGLRSVHAGLKQALLKVATEDSDIEIKKAARRVLFNWLDDVPGLREELERLSKESPL